MTRLLVLPVVAVLLAAVLVVVFRHPDPADRGLLGPSVLSADRAVRPVESTSDVVRGTPRDSRPHRSHPIRAVHLDVTSYCETGNRTASGVWPRYGMAASNLFPFGTRLRVPGWPVVVTVTDRVGWGADLDLYAMSCERAIQWGRRSLLVEVLSR